MCPDQFSLEALLQIKDTIKPHHWNALYQGRPAPRSGGMFTPDSFVTWENGPSLDDGKIVRAWDVAATSDGDWTAGVKLQKTAAKVVYVLDVVRIRKTEKRRDGVIKATAEMDGKNVQIWGQQDPGSAGKDAASAFRRMLDGYSVRTEPKTGDKEVRADPMASYAEVEPLRVLRTDWTKDYITEHLGFPNAKHDDQVDAASDAFNHLSGPETVIVAAGGVTGMALYDV